MFLTHLHALFRRRRRTQTTTAYSSWKRLQRPPWTWTRSSWLLVRYHLCCWLSSSTEQNTATWHQLHLPQRRSTRHHTKSFKYRCWFNSDQSNLVCLWRNVWYFSSQNFCSQEASEERTARWGGEWRTGQRRSRLTGDSTSGQKRPVLWRRQLTIGPISWQMHPRTDTDTQTQYESIVWDPFTYDPALNFGQLELQNWKQAIDTLVNQHGNVSTIYPSQEQYMQTFTYTHTHTRLCHLWVVWFVLYSFDKTKRRQMWPDLTSRT